MSDFNPNWIPRQRRKRWFIQRGATTWFDRGFKSKQAASDWIDSQPIDWRVGFTFRRNGDDTDMYVVSRNGQLAKP